MMITINRNNTTSRLNDSIKGYCVKVNYAAFDSKHFGWPVDKSGGGNIMGIDA